MMLDARFRGHDDWKTTDFYSELLKQDARVSGLPLTPDSGLRTPDHSSLRPERFAQQHEGLQLSLVDGNLAVLRQEEAALGVEQV